MATTTKLVQATSDWVLGHLLNIHVPHATQTLLPNENTQYFSASRLTSYEILLLLPSHITIRHCQNLNPATLLPLPTDGTSRDCVVNTRSLSCPRLDLAEKPLPQVDLTLHVESSYLRKGDGAFQAAYAITDQYKPLEYRALPHVRSAHVAKLSALTWACLRA